MVWLIDEMVAAGETKNLWQPEIFKSWGATVIQKMCCILDMGISSRPVANDIKKTVGMIRPVQMAAGIFSYMILPIRSEIVDLHEATDSSRLWPHVMAVCTVILTVLAMIGGASGLVKYIVLGARVVFRCKARVSHQETVMTLRIDELTKQLADATTEVVALKLNKTKLVSDIAALGPSATMTTSTSLPAKIFVSGGSGTKYHTSETCQGLNVANIVVTKSLCLHCSNSAPRSQG